MKIAFQDRPVIFVDLEASGLGRESYPIEVGWSVRVNGAQLGEVEALDGKARALTLTVAPPGTVAAGDVFEATPPARAE